MTPRPTVGTLIRVCYDSTYWDGQYRVTQVLPEGVMAFLDEPHCSDQPRLIYFIPDTHIVDDRPKATPGVLYVYRDVPLDTMDIVMVGLTDGRVYDALHLNSIPFDPSTMRKARL